MHFQQDTGRIPSHPFVLTTMVWLAIVSASEGQQELVTESPLAPEEAARTMVVPEGFRVTLFAGEPDVQQPIGFCLDDRGRLWVAEAYNYPNHGTTPGDRLLIFEDTDGDGRFDRRKVFYDQLNYVTGVEVGFGGAWVMSPPYFYFIADRDGDDRPDGPPQVLLDAFGNHANAHNLANGFAWGPDGWLYGTHGRTNWSMIGKPGTPESGRVRFDGGVWRYHPVRHVWEPFADGTTNPWGIDWNDFGEGFVCNCVNPHLFHVIRGAHYEPWRNRESSRYAYERIPSIADHLHFVGINNVRDGLGSAEEDAAGGGHAHCGTMVYLGDSWPAEYRNTVFLNNIHGKRINNDLPRRSGSGYTAAHGRDLMRSRDPWFMGVTLQYGPDGNVFVSDWSDTGECHSIKNTRRHTGRIFKISYGSKPHAAINLAELSDDDLVAYQLHRNDWFVRHARRLLQERAAAGHNMAEVHEKLLAMFAEQSDVTRRLRALWALHVTGGLDETFLLHQLDDPNEYLRSWGARLLMERQRPSRAALDRFRELAASGSSSYERLHLASILQQLPLAERWAIARALASREEDSNDINLPLMVWYGVEPLIEDDLARFIELGARARLPLLRRHVARRAVSTSEPQRALDLLGQQLTTAPPEFQQDLLEGMLIGLSGQRAVKLPSSWPAVYPELRASSVEKVREYSLQLALIFDDPVALASIWREAGDKGLDAARRQRAVAAIVSKRASGTAAYLIKLTQDPATRQAAIRGLADFDEPATANTLLAGYRSWDAAARQDALQTLASRSAWGSALLDAVESEQLPRSDLTAYTIRQLLSLKDKKLAARVEKLWGNVRTTPADKSRLIADYKRKLTPAVLARADRSAGRAVFERTCANCHRLFDHGGKIGPELTGAQRFNLDYVLENLVDPSAAISKDFQMQVLETSNGRLITGIVIDESDVTLTVQTANEQIVVPRSEIDDQTISPVSLMPEGMLPQLTSDQVRDLIAYLASPAQVPLPGKP